MNAASHGTLEECDGVVAQVTQSLCQTGDDLFEDGYDAVVALESMYRLDDELSMQRLHDQRGPILLTVQKDTPWTPREHFRRSTASARNSTPLVRTWCPPAKHTRCHSFAICATLDHAMQIRGKYTAATETAAGRGNSSSSSFDAYIAQSTTHLGRREL